MLVLVTVTAYILISRIVTALKKNMELLATSAEALVLIWRLPRSSTIEVRILVSPQKIVHLLRPKVHAYNNIRNQLATTYYPFSMLGGYHNMKLKGKILALSLVPVLVLGITMFLVAADRIANGIYDAAYNGMQATTFAVRDIFEEGKSWFLMLLYACTLGRNKCRFFAKEAVFYAWKIVDERGNRQINTKASAEVAERVLQNGETYHDSISFVSSLSASLLTRILNTMLHSASVSFKILDQPDQ